VGGELVPLLYQGTSWQRFMARLQTCQQGIDANQLNNVAK